MILNPDSFVLKLTHFHLSGDHHSEDMGFNRPKLPPCRRSLFPKPLTAVVGVKSNEFKNFYIIINFVRLKLLNPKFWKFSSSLRKVVLV
ncbi:unnamed protein product [Caenorhabditis nigoni]